MPNKRDDTKPDRIGDPANLGPGEHFEKPHDYIETTRPEDPSDHAGQQTRDNVNPAIPSAEPKALREAKSQQPPLDIGEPEGAKIIPPNEGGIEPTPNLTRDEVLAYRAERGDKPAESVNEPPGSVVLPDDATGEAEAFRAGQLGEVKAGVIPGTPTTPVADAEHSEEDTNGYKLPPPSELEAMTRAELDAMAEDRGVDITGAKVKQDVIDALRKDARRRKREENR
jgi:hypothetical protein